MPCMLGALRLVFVLPNSLNTHAVRAMPPQSKYLGVGSSNRKNQWQARILYHGKVGLEAAALG